MQITGNTILITGGGSGIGRALAEAFHARGNQVIIAGRRRSVLDETMAANPGMKAALLDIESASAIQGFAAQMKRDFPALNAVIHNAGIMRPEQLRDGAVADAEAIVTTNLLGPIRLTAAGDDDLVAEFVEGLCKGAADTGAAAGDEDGIAGDVHEAVFS